MPAPRCLRPRFRVAALAGACLVTLACAQPPREERAEFPFDELRRTRPSEREGGSRGPGRTSDESRRGFFGPESRAPLDDAGGSLIHLEGGGIVDEETVRTARETASHSTGTPEWQNPSGFKRDVFTFARIIFRSNLGRYGYGGRMGWVNDYPDSDLNLSWRLQQLTALKVDPDTRVLKLTHRDLFEFPFIYMVKPGRMQLGADEVLALRQYLLNGGALLTDDTWGRSEWENLERELQRVLPGRGWTDLPREHAVFHCVFQLDKARLQVPPIQRWSRSGMSSRGTEDTEQAQFRALLDDQGRIMVLSAHNTDLGDGWEREGENDEYFHTFSEPRAYPMAVNIIFYLMTH